MVVSDALVEIDALRTALDQASEALLSAAERGLAISARSSESEALAEVFNEIMAVCAFQDLADQRLTRLAHNIAGKPDDERPDAALLNGPANDGGLDQAAADALFENR